MDTVIKDDITIVKSITTKYGLIEFRSDNILTYHPNNDSTQFTLPELKKIVSVFVEITDGKPVPYYCDISSFTNDSSQECKAYMKETLHTFASLCAVVKKSSIITYLANMFIYLYKPKVPTKLFNNKQVAIKWLKE